MISSNLLIAKIKQFEGYRSKAYRCSAGVLTCGYGHTKGVTDHTVCNTAGCMIVGWECQKENLLGS